MSTQSLGWEERLAAGKALRSALPRTAHADWSTANERRDPVELLESSNRGRLSRLTPLRYGRMLRSPFAFLRGAAVTMAYDLAQTPATGLVLQVCGDCHLANFGLFGTPERNLVFDINDFDETLCGPWEWDLKRLAASVVLAGRTNGFTEQQCAEIAQQCAQSYREHLREFSTMSPLEIWYFRVCADELVENAPDAEARERREKMVAKARGRVAERLLPKIAEEIDGRHRFVENLPVVTRIAEDRYRTTLDEGIEQYRASLTEDRRLLFDRYRLDDFAMRVVGVGSVGTRCFVALLVCDDRNPLLLQIKEARPSVLEPYVAKSPFQNQGQRVVVGQRVMQTASDIFLGWLRSRDGHDYYVRQMRDMKYSIPLDDAEVTGLGRYAAICGWSLARAHAKGGDAATISGYLGGSEKFDEAISKFALAYADQTERDHAALVEAKRTGRIEVIEEE
ncbi:MAG TPA: DUF2252 domain-containing protein [Pirellulales bacterium]|jgi:uncharacterized protein (DUF2252 family)